MSKKEVVMFGDESTEKIRIEVDGKEIADCNAYETDYWVSAIVQALGGTYKEEVEEE